MIRNSSAHVPYIKKRQNTAAVHAQYRHYQHVIYTTQFSITDPFQTGRPLKFVSA